MSELPEKQVKRLHSLIQEAETNLAAAKELLISIIGDDGSVVTPRNSTLEDVGGKVIEGVFDGLLRTTAALFTSKLVRSSASKSSAPSSSMTARTLSRQTAMNTAFFWPA